MSRAFDHVLVLMFENQYRSSVLANSYMRKLARLGIDLTNSCGVMHPSQTNYIASISGELCNVTSDDALVPPLPQRTIVDLIEESPLALRWKAYMESYIPQNTPWTPTLVPKDEPPYFVKHNPFASFATIVNNPARWAKIDNESALFADLLNGSFPEYAWFTPNIWNDGHYVNGTLAESNPRAPQLVDQVAVWLEGFFGRLRFPGPNSHFPPRTLVVVTFDEADFEIAFQERTHRASSYDGPNQIYTVLLGDVVTPGRRLEGYNHYSVLRTIEKNFDLGTLGKNDTGANWFQFLWGREFLWGAAQPTPIARASHLAATGFAGAAYVVYASDDGAVFARTHSRNGWSDAESLGVGVRGPSNGLAVARVSGGLLLAYRSDGGALETLTYTLDDGWSKTPVAVAGGPVGAIALASFDFGRRAMLVFESADGLRSMEFANGSFVESVSIAAANTDGDLSLSTLGASLYLIYRQKGGTELHVLTYNTASFNAVTVPANKYGGTQDDSSVNAWSPTAFPVCRYASSDDRSSSGPVGEAEPIQRTFTSRAPLATAVLDGVLHLVHPGPSNQMLLTETFSVAGLLTPSHPVSFAEADAATCCNGFGTMAMASWGPQTPIHGSACGDGAAIAMANSAECLLILSQRDRGGAVHLCAGRYELAGESEGMARQLVLAKSEL